MTVASPWDRPLLPISPPKELPPLLSLRGTSPHCYCESRFIGTKQSRWKGINTILDRLPAQEGISLLVANNAIPDVVVINGLVSTTDGDYFPRLVQPWRIRVFEGVNVLHFRGVLARSPGAPCLPGSLHILEGVAHSATILSHEAGNVILANHSNIHGADILNDPPSLTAPKSPTSLSKGRLINRSYLVSLPIESARKAIPILNPTPTPTRTIKKNNFNKSNWLPAFPLIGCRARKFLITGGSGIKVIHQSVVPRQVVPDGIQIIPSTYFQVLGKRESMTATNTIKACRHDI